MTTDGVPESLAPNFQATITSAVSTAMPASASTSTFRSMPRSWWTRGATRRGASSRPSRDEAGAELVDVELAVEPEELGVRAQEALDVRMSRQHRELLVFERADVLRANLRRELDLRVLEALPHPGLAQAVADLEHADSVETSLPALDQRSSRTSSS